MLALLVRLDSDHIEFMLPAMSSVPLVDNDFDLDLDKTSLMPANCFALFDVSRAFAWAASPDEADIIAVTSWAVLSIMSRFRFVKSVN